MLRAFFALGASGECDRVTGMCSRGYGDLLDFMGGVCGFIGDGECVDVTLEVGGRSLRRVRNEERVYTPYWEGEVGVSGIAG